MIQLSIYTKPSFVFMNQTEFLREINFFHKNTFYSNSFIHHSPKIIPQPKKVNPITSDPNPQSHDLSQNAKKINFV